MDLTNYPDCAICFEKARHAIRLDCSHIFCYYCNQRQIKIKNSPDGEAHCSLCRATIRRWKFVDAKANQWDVESVIDTRYRGKATQYLVAWKKDEHEFAPDRPEFSWEPTKNLTDESLNSPTGSNSKKALEKFRKARRAYNQRKYMQEKKRKQTNN